MSEHPQFREGGQFLEVAVVDPSYLEHVVGADDGAVVFCFAASVIDDRGPCARGGVAPLPGAVWVLRCRFLVSASSVVLNGDLLLFWVMDCSWGPKTT